jgi:hypothetical protein
MSKQLPRVLVVVGLLGLWVVLARVTGHALLYGGAGGIVAALAAAATAWVRRDRAVRPGGNGSPPRSGDPAS